MHKKIRSLGPRIQSYLLVQLSITLCSWPLFATWGLPISCASTIGNLLFAPFLTGFLFLASIIYLCDLCSLYPSLCIFLLEELTSLWTTLLSYSERSWVCVVTHPPLWITYVLPPITLAIHLYKPFQRTTRIYLLMGICVGVGYVLPLIFSYQDVSYQIPFYHTQLTLTRSQGITTLTDPGILGRYPSAPQKVAFTVVPFLRTKGIHKLTHVRIEKLSATTCRSLTCLVEALPVHHIFLPPGKNKLSNRGWNGWEELLKTAQKYDTKIHQEQNNRT